MRKKGISKSSFVLLASALGGLGFLLASLLFGHFSILHWLSLPLIMVSVPWFLRQFFIVFE